MAGQGRQVFVYRVDTGGGERDVVSVLESEWVFRHGLRPEVIIGVLREGADTDRIAPDDVGENPTFLRLLSRVIFEHVGECDGMRREGEVQGTGYVYLIDARTPDPGGRVPAEDIIGAVTVSDGVLVPGSYQHNPRHRLLTVNGWFHLPDELEAALQRRLRTRRAAGSDHPGPRSDNR